MSSPTPFAPTFDAIDVDAAPRRAAIEHAMAMCAIEGDAEAPGFYLLNDAGGRLVIDRAFGFVSLKDEATLESERDNILDARIRVIEPSGLVYELDLRLRVTGHVPQMVGGDEVFDAPVAPLQKIGRPKAAWTRFSATNVGSHLTPLADVNAAFGALFGFTLTEADAPVTALELVVAAPGPTPADAAWSI